MCMVYWEVDGTLDLETVEPKKWTTGIAFKFKSCHYRLSLSDTKKNVSLMIKASSTGNLLYS